LLNSKVADLGEMVQIMFYLRLPKPHAEIPALNIQPYKPVILLIVQKVSCELSMPRHLFLKVSQILIFVAKSMLEQEKSGSVIS